MKTTQSTRVVVTRMTLVAGLVALATAMPNAGTRAKLRASVAETGGWACILVLLVSLFAFQPRAAIAQDSLLLLNVGHTNTGGSARSVRVQGDYAFLANFDDGISTFDVRDPAQPLNIGHTNTGAWAMDLAVAGNYAYIANYTNGLVVLDIANPFQPAVVAMNYPTGVVAASYSVDVANGYAYLANDMDGLRIYDISNPTNPINIGHIDISGQIYDVDVAGRYAYLAATWQGMRIFDISNPTNPVSLGQVNDGDAARSITVEGNYAYVAADGLRIYNISNPTNPVSVAHLSTGGEPWEISVAANRAYVANGTDGPRVYDVIDPTNPILLGHANTGGGLAYGVAVSGAHMYVANAYDGLRIYEIITQSATNCTAKPLGLVAWWPGDGFALDVAGANHAWLQNHAGYARGKVGPAFLFDGVADAVNAGARTELVLTNNFSLEAWVFPTGPGTAGAGGIIVNKEGEYEIARYPDGSIRWALANSTPGWTYINTGLTAPLSNWTHVVLVCSNSTVITHTNGALGHIYSGSGDVGDITTSMNDYQIGGRQGGGQYFQGRIDEVSVYKRVLQSDEIRLLYAAGPAGKCYTNNPAPVFVQHPASRTGLVLGSVTLTAAAMGMPRPEYQWLFKGVPLADRTNATLVLNNLSSDQGGEYWVLANNTFGSATSTVALLTLEEPVAGASWDASSEFSTASNPNGPWSYGRRWSASGDGFDLCGYLLSGTFWLLGSGIWSPSIQSGPDLWAGNNGRGYPVVRWTCPKSGNYQISSRFIGADSRGVDTLVYVVIGGVPVFSGHVQGYGSFVPYSNNVIYLNQGAYVDHVVAWSGAIYSEYNWTVVNATFTRIDPQVFNNPERFESGWGDWYADGSRQWQIRFPGNGPVSPNSGTNAACGNTGGNYPAGRNSRLITPRLFVPQVDPGNLVTLRFWEWHQYGTGDGGLVQLSRWNGSGWDDWATLDSVTNGTSSAWSQHFVDLMAYQGQPVRVAFYHTADSDGSVGVGWYIDDVEISQVMSPQITTQPQSWTGKAGSSVTFTVAGTGTPPLGYRWQFNTTDLSDNARVSGSSASTLSIANVTTNDLGDYRAVVTNIYGSATSAVAALTFDTTPPATSLASVPATVCSLPYNFSWSGTDNATPIANLLYSYQLDAEGWSTFGPATSLVVAQLADGSHTFTVKALDLAGNVETNPPSANFQVDTTAPVISGVSSSPAADHCTITWRTDEPATSRADYGLTAGYGQSASSSQLVTNHTLTVSGLQATTPYHFWVTSRDACGHEAVSGDVQFTTTPAPDLRVVSVSMPQEAWTGREFDVAWVLTNAGLGTATGPWVDRLYLSATNQLYPNQDQLLGEFPFLGHLDPGQSVQLIQSVAVDRAGVTNRSYYISMWTDAGNSVYEGLADTNNVGTSVSNINIHVTPLPDLFVASVDAPTNGIGGQPVEVSWIVCNQGGADTDIPIWYDHVYLSSTTNIANAVADYGLVENPYYLAFGDCYLQSTLVTLPVGIGGPYYFIVQADSSGWLDEEGTVNNKGCTVVPIDIQFVEPGFLNVESVQVAPAPPTTVWAGGVVTVTWTVRNTGHSTITGTWDDEVTLSPTPTYDFVNGYWDVIHHVYFTGPLAPGQAYTHTGQFTVPQGISAGNWYAVPIVDTHFFAGGNGAIGSGNIGRNQNSALVQVAVPPPCDLEVTGVSGPTNAVAGQPMSVRWTVANNGNNQTSSGYWYDALYLSTNLTFDPNQSRLIGTYGHWGALDLTSNYTQNVSVTVPADLLGTNMVATNYLFVVADAGNAVVEYTKTNNVLGARSSIVITQIPPADLAVTAVVAPITVIQGSAATISWTVTNLGAGPASAASWTDRVYLASDTTLDHAQWLGDVPHTGALGPGASYNQSQAFNLPHCAIGQYFVSVVADSGRQLNEGGLLKNNSRASDQPMRIWPGNAARLQVSAVTPPWSVSAGAPLTVSWTVRNPGSATTNAPWTDALYLSATPQFTPGSAHLLGLYPHTNNLASGGSYSQTQSPIVPRCFSGPYYVYVITDVGNVVNSISCNTNNWASASTPVQVTPGGYASLQVAGMSLPSSVNSGIPWAIQWTVTNAGPSAASGTWSDAVYASLSPALDASAMFLGRFDYASGLASGTTYTQTQSVAFPQCLSGTYYIYVLADAENHVNATACVVNSQGRSTAPLAVNVGAHPDLVVSAVSIPSTAYAGQPMTVSWSVTNTGLATASGPWLDSVYLSASSVFNSSASVFLGAYFQAAALTAGAGYTQTASFTLPNETHGRLYAYVVADSTNAVQECQGEDNNVSSSSSTVTVPVTLYSDLKVTAVNVPANAYAGQNMNVSWGVANQGTDSTPNSTVWNDAVFLSKDQVLDPSDKRLGTFPRPSSLGVGQNYTNSASVQIPAAVSGPCYVLVLADSGNALFKYLGYNDSLGWNPSAMMVSLPATADLAATSVTLDPAAAVPGDPVNIGWNVRNVSSNSIPATWTDAAYLSTNTVWDINAVAVARRDRSGLPASAAYSDSWTGPLPALTPGSYHAVVRTDVRNTVRETNLVNNTAISTNTIAVDVPVLVLGQPATNTLTTGSVRYYKLNVPAGETVRVTLTGASTNSFNELFVRYGSIPDLGSYDFLYSTPFAPNQQIDIPTTQAGWYYIMVRGGNEPGGPLGYMLRADIVPFAIGSVSANHIGDNGQVTITVKGARFQAGATVQLVSGTNIYSAITNFFTDATSVRARFVFTNAVQGIYDLVLTNPNSQSTTTTQSITIETVSRLTTEVVPGLVDNQPRAGLPFKWNGAVVNAGNVDVQYTYVAIGLSQPFRIALNPPPGAVLAETNSTDNSHGSCSFLARDLAPSEPLAFSFVVSGFGSESFLYDIISTERFTSTLLQQTLDQAEAARRYVVAHPESLTNQPADVVSALSDSNLWAELVLNRLVSLGVLDAAVLADLSQPRGTSLGGRGRLTTLPKTKGANIDQLRPLAIAPKFLNPACNNCVTEANNCWNNWSPYCIICTTYSPNNTCSGCRDCYGEYFDCMRNNNCSGPCPFPNGVCPPRPRDPNEMLGPAGYSAAAFVGSQVPWQYTIFFENTSNALAFARQIIVTNVLDPSFDVRTFRVSEIAFGNITITVPTNRSFYQTRIAAPYPNPTNIVVDVTAGIDAQHGVVLLTLNAIDLNTGQLVEDVNLGVLPPNTINHIGEGHITYTIKPKSSVPTGTVVTNQAAIVFDTNDPISTNPTTNTVDALPPTSSVVYIPSVLLTTNFTVYWFGTDDAGGSGVGSYDIYVSDNGGPWQAWQTGTSATGATFGGQPGHYYYFYGIAHDNAGNVEAAPSNFQAMTFVSGNQPPILQPIPDQEIRVGGVLTITNLVSSADDLQGLSFSLEGAPSGAHINPTNGIFTWAPTCAEGSTTNLITVWAADTGTPPMSNAAVFLVIVPECIEAALGDTVMLAGQTSSVPIRLLSTTALTNMTFTVTYPPDRFTDFAMTVNSPQVLTQQLRQLQAGQLQLSFTLPESSVLHGPTNVGRLSFTAAANQSSAFVPLLLSDVSGLKPDGAFAAETNGYPGRVVVVGGEPLLEARPVTNRNVLLTIYGNPGSNYFLHYSTNLSTGEWLPAWVVPMTNLWQNFEINLSEPQMFYRAQ